MQRTLLLVDDQVTILRTLSLVLRDEGYEILTAGSGQEALALLDRHAVGVVVSDNRMPGMDGAEFLAEVARRCPDTMRLMLSGFADFDAVVSALNQGAIHKFIPKPWQNEAVRKTIAESFAAFEAKRDPLDPLTGWQQRAVWVGDCNRALRSARVDSLHMFVGEIQDLAVLTGALNSAQTLSLFREVRSRIDTLAPNSWGPAVVEGMAFAILVPTEDPNAFAQQLIGSLSVPMLEHEGQIRLRIRIGSAAYDQLGMDAEALLRHALIALTSMGAYGNDRYRAYHEDLRVSLQHRLSLERDLHHALARRELFYVIQPVVRVPSRSLAGGEALIRWQHPTRGLVSPLEFIDLAERNGVIGAIGSWMLEQACLRLATWRQRGLHSAYLSVNVSPRQFDFVDLSEVIGSLREELAFDPNQLLIEVTESTLMEPTDRNLNVLKRLKDQGVRIALDDFGTGHSSLVQLRSFPLDMIKIDRSFVRTIDRSHADLTLLRNMVRMGRERGLEVVAEGVETEEQLSICEAIGCTLVQGYYFAKPEDATAFDMRVMTAHGAMHANVANAARANHAAPK